MVQGAAAAGDARAQRVQPTTESTAPVKAASPQFGTTGQLGSRQAAKSPQTRPAARSYGPPSRYLPNRFAGRAGAYYKYVWGVDSLSVKLMESGELVRFTWRVVDADRAGVLNDKQAAPSLIDPNAGVSLVVPTLEKIGQLRQSQAPEVGKAYWVAFSNKGRVVKRGDRVNVVIGPFRAEGLAVD
jgi:hypothetical protein